ncbi:LCP family protein [Dactylosporangium sp. AC04546]|uniref:LCP family protein n=1 Tax=Dactylosporangium sp. AC04546 TaxID=2862460 RepID=UPI001EE1386C|nr:LCP family protein [Dactylosporangium sp. AC04546]WVK81429.1 LCP family protein [Dactylosporangium sp. AC04546]
MSRKKRIWLIVAASLVVIIGGSLLGVSLWVRSVTGDVKRVDAFSEVPEADRPQKAEGAKGAMNFLLLGSDTRDPENQGGSRSDTIIVLHLDNNRSKAQMVSIPRDTWVYVPKSKNGKFGDTNAKINASYAWGGVPLVVQTVERFTGVRIDHVAIVDFSGFREIVDALGGVEIDVTESFTSTHSLNPDGKRHFEKGLQTMDGAAALDYARERYAFKDGDFARIRHQQQVIKAILNKAASGGTLTNPSRLNSFLHATADSVTVDGTLNIFDMAMELRSLRGDDLSFYTSPTKGTGMMGSESVVLADTDKVKPFYDALREDQPLPAPTK